LSKNQTEVVVVRCSILYSKFNKKIVCRRASDPLGSLQRSCRPSSCFAADNGEGMKEREGGERRKERDISRTKILAIWPWQCSIL